MVYSVILHNNTDNVLNNIVISYGDTTEKHFTLHKYETVLELKSKEYQKINIPTDTPIVEPPYTEELSAADAEKGLAYSGQYSYDHAGRMMTKMDAENNTYTNTYDMLGQVIKETDAKGGMTEYTYDEFGEVQTKSVYVGESRSVKGYEYDRAGNMIREYTTNDIGEESSKREISYGYDNRNRLVYTKNKNDDGSDVYTETVYDKAGNLTDVYVGSTVPGARDGKHTSYMYDHLNRVIRITDPMGREEKYISYDGNGNLTKKRDKNGKEIIYTYTGLNQPETVMVMAGAETKGEYTNYKYYNTGLPSVVNVRDKNGKVTHTGYTYDSFGRLKSESEEGIKKEYSYNHSDLRTNFKVTDESGSTLMEESYEYNALNRLSKVYKGTPSEENIIAEYSYDANGNPTEVINGNGTKRIYEYYEEKSPNLLKKVSNTGKAGEELSSCDYSYAADGNIASVTEKTGNDSRSIGYGYDSQGRLKTETDSLYGSTSYAYDRYGNRAKKTQNGDVTTYTYNGNNQLVCESREDAGKNTVINYTYDRNGNMISRP